MEEDCSSSSKQEDSERTATTIAVTNEEVYMVYKELLEKAKLEKRKVSVKELNSCLSEKYESFAVSESNPSTIFNKVQGLYNRVATLNRNKNKKGKIDLFCKPFNVPQKLSNEEKSLNSAKSNKEKELITESHHFKRENKILKRSHKETEEGEAVLSKELTRLIFMYIDALQNMQDTIKKLESFAATKQSEARLLKSNLETINSEFEEKSKKLDHITELYADCKRKLSSAKVKNMTKKLKRREDTIKTQFEQIKTLKEEKETAINEANESKELYEAVSEELESSFQELEMANNNIESLKSEKKKMQFKVSYLKRKYAEKNSNDQDQRLVDQINLYEEQLKNLEDENRELEQFVALLEENEIVTFQDGRYCDEVREVIMDLLSMDVSMSQVNNVIKTVLKKLANKNVSKLPSMGLKSRLLLEARWLAKCQVGRAMESKNIEIDKGNCLHGDGTTKYHRKYQNFQVTTKSGRSYTIGLNEMAGGDTAATMQAFVQTLDEISETFSDVSDDESKK